MRRITSSSEDRNILEFSSGTETIAQSVEMLHKYQRSLLMQTPMNSVVWEGKSVKGDGFKTLIEPFNN